MHAERNRRYRARTGRVTDHGPVMEHEAGLLRRLEASKALREPSSERAPPRHGHCHHCGRSASLFLRLSVLRSELRPGKKRQIIRGASRFDCPP
jgi:hypothetical protein